MAMPYPQKQTIIIFIVCALTVGVIAAYVSNQKTRAAGRSQETLPIETSRPSPLSGIGDAFASSTEWKSFFTDEKKLALSGAAPADTSDAGMDPNNLTDAFGKDFFSRFMVLQQNDLAQDPEAVKTAVDQSTKQFVYSAPQPTVYGERDIAISAASDAVAEKTYGNAVGIAFLDMPRSDAATIATEALSKNEPDRLADIDPIVKGYSLMLDALLKTPVPASMASYHIRLVNGVSAMLFVSQGMRKATTDPVQTLIALSAYESSQTLLRESLLDLKAYYSARSISFGATEPGVLFVQISN